MQILEDHPGGRMRGSATVLTPSCSDKNLFFTPGHSPQGWARGLVNPEPTFVFELLSFT